MPAIPKGPSSVLRPLIEYLLDPYGAAVRALEKYGDPLEVNTPAGKMVMTSNPELIREIFSAGPETFAAFSLDLLGELIGEGSLMVISGERHRAVRKLLAPPFHGERMRQYGRLMQETALRWASRWPKGSPFRMDETAHAITLEVIIQAVFGVTESSQVEVLRNTLLSLLGTVHPSFVFVRSLRRNFGGQGPYARFQRALHILQALISEQIASRRQTGRQGEDILSMLLQARYDDGSALEEREIQEQLLALLFAGKEPTAVALTWAFHLVHHHPLVLERLRAELGEAGPQPTPETLAALPYLEAVCLETLRLYPVVPVLGRRLTRPLRLGGYEVPAGVGLGISVVAAHRRAELYPAPHRFRPERFLERKYSAFEFMPFGGGARRCPAAAFAMYQMKIVLGTLVQRYRLRNARSTPPRVVPRATFAAPARGVEMIAAAEATS